MESISVNSASLEKQLEDKSVPAPEIKGIMETVDKRYHERVDAIVEECDKDMMALEHVPSPLRLFVDCIAEAQESLNLSQPAQALLQKYTAAWEDWM
ncbi:MAG TPA: hypothetical protein VF172_01810 [Nitrososphaera sp.]|jgi:hypothetical protein